MAYLYHQNSPPKFYCKKCDYGCSKKSHWDQHLLTAKHKSVSFVSKNSRTPNEIICKCGKKYKTKCGYKRHQAKCKKIIGENAIVDKDVNPDDFKQLVGMFNKLVEENEKLTDLIKNLPPTTTNTLNNNQQYDINIFLNDTCKDAINISDFVKTLMIGMDELEIARNRGIMEGVSSVFVNGLNKLEVSQRPIHCTDAKNKTLYIKDEDKWAKNNKELIKDTIDVLQKRHISAINTWQQDHPNWANDPKEQEMFWDFIKQINPTISNSDKNKIITNISNEVEIDVKNI